jgi:polysaccharide biosynthesis/export protein
MAGGIREGALESGAYLERNVGWSANPWLSPRRGAFHNTRLADRDFVGREYLASELREGNRVSLALDRFESIEAAIVLQDGDRLVVPRDEGTVYVFGQVNRPGHIAVSEGGTPMTYIERAGGMSSAAADIIVIEAGTGRHIPVREAGTIRTGDMIFVARRSDIADTAEMQLLVMEESRMLMEERRMRSEARFRTSQTILQLAGTAAGVVTTFLILRSRNN